MDGLPSFRAGCVGFVVKETSEFWVMGGYGESRTMLPVDEYYRDALVMKLKNDNSGRWREVSDIWEQVGRARCGKIAVMEDEGQRTEIFVLDMIDILRYDIAANHWKKKTTVTRKGHYKRPSGFVVLDGELYVLTLLKGPPSYGACRLGQFIGTTLLFAQIYNPCKKTWSSSSQNHHSMRQWILIMLSLAPLGRNISSCLYSSYFL